MINLLPHETKQQIRAARTNVLLVRYIIIIGLAMVFLGLFVVGIYFVLSNIESNAKQTIAANSNSTSQYGSAQSQAEALKASVQSAKSVLDSEVLYTKMITSIANLVPTGVVINKLTLSPQTIGTASTIQGYAKTTDKALALKDAFQNSPLFSNVTIQNISASGGITNYPVNIVLGLTINPGVSQ